MTSRRYPTSLASLFVAMLLLGQSGFAQDNPFAALEVVAAGKQSFDVATGVTTLVDGGDVVDHESGLSLSGSVIRFKDGAFVEVEGAHVEAEFGLIEAGRVYFDMSDQTLTASEGASFRGNDMALEAETLTIHLGPSIGVATGDVTSRSPSLRAGAMVVDISERMALLVGPYRYQDGPLTLASESEGEVLGLRWLEPAEEGGEVAFEATTEVAPERLEALEPYLPESAR